MTSFGIQTQLKLGTRLTELQDSIKHIFEGQAQFRKELEHVKLDLVSKTVSKADFDSQLLLKANKQTVANALQRKANKVDLESKLGKIEQALQLNTTGNGKTLLERLNDLEKSLQDQTTHLDLTLDEKMSKKLNTVEAEIKKICTRDMQRVDTELLILNTNFSTLSTEYRALEEKVRNN